MFGLHITLTRVWREISGNNELGGFVMSLATRKYSALAWFAIRAGKLRGFAPRLSALALGLGLACASGASFAVNGDVWVVSCAACQTTADFDAAAKQASHQQQ